MSNTKNVVKIISVALIIILAAALICSLIVLYNTKTKLAVKQFGIDATFSYHFVILCQLIGGTNPETLSDEIGDEFKRLIFDHAAVCERIYNQTSYKEKLDDKGNENLRRLVGILYNGCFYNDVYEKFDTEQLARLIKLGVNFTSANIEKTMKLVDEIVEIYLEQNKDI